MANAGTFRTHRPKIRSRTFPMARPALKFLLTLTVLQRAHRRIDWVWRISIFSTLVTVALIVLYLWRDGAMG